MKREFQFQVGDRVRCVEDDSVHLTTKEHIGLTGVVYRTSSFGGQGVYTVEHDETNSILHSDHGRGPINKCWNYFAHEIELISSSVCEVEDLL